MVKYLRIREIKELSSRHIPVLLSADENFYLRYKAPEDKIQVQNGGLELKRLNHYNKLAELMMEERPVEVQVKERPLQSQFKPYLEGRHWDPGILLRSTGEKARCYSERFRLLFRLL